jgi:heat shock protein HslJ
MVKNKRRFLFSHFVSRAGCFLYTVFMNNKFLFIALSVLVIVIVAIVGIRMIRFNSGDAGDGMPEENVAIAELVCDDGATAVATYYAPDERGVMRQLTLVMTDASGIETRYDMVPAISASGAKFASADGAVTFWEHHDTFTFAREDETIRVCARPVPPVSEVDTDESSPIVGGDRDEHGCIGSAGYSWCEAKGKCLRPWEESCTTSGDTISGLVGHDWTWVRTTYADGSVVVPKRAGVFRLTFGADGRVSVATDCNSMGGSYVAKGSTVTFSDMMSTLMYCEGSQEQAFSAMLGDVKEFHIADGTLSLVFGDGAGVMELR